MATFTGVDILTGTTEGLKYNANGNTSVIYTAAVTTALVSTDIITGPTLPAGNYLIDVIVDSTDLDTNATPLVAFKCGYTGATAAFIATANTTMTTGGVQHANVAGSNGFSATTDTQVIVTMTASAATAAAGTVRICIIYTASP